MESLVKLIKVLLILAVALALLGVLAFVGWGAYNNHQVDKALTDPA